MVGLGGGELLGFEVRFRCLGVMWWWCGGGEGGWTLRWLRSLGIGASSWWLVVRVVGWLEELDVC